MAVAEAQSTRLSDLVVSNQHSKPRATSRLESLDLLRGITIAFMILVNTIWHFPVVYAPLEHAAWNGWTPADLIFPAFLFLMGSSVVFSTESRLSRGVQRSALVAHLLKRFLILFALGLLINAFPYFHLSTLRIYGVLQRIAVCYFVAGAFYLWGRRIRTTVVFLVAILVGYWALMRFVPVPGFGAPGHDVAILDPKGNLVSWLDRLIFPGRLFEPGLGDPEGLLSDLPSIATTLFGGMVGIWLRSRRSPARKCAGMLAAGVAAVLCGLLWNLWFPINKRLWTSSYVLFTAGVVLIAWAFLYWLVDIKGWKKVWPTFWLVFGTNAISAYVLSELLEAATEQIPVPPRMSIDLLIYHHAFSWIRPAEMASLAYAVCFVLVCWVPILVLYRKRIFIKI
jgi:predicted acyltransferase